MSKFKTLSKIFVVVAILLLASSAYAGFDSYTKLVSHFNGSNGQTTYTAETGQSFTFIGTAQLSTAQTKFGTASVLLDGDSDYLTLPDSDDWSFADGDFTIDFWIYFNSLTGEQDFVCHHADGNNYWSCYQQYGSTKLAMDFWIGGVRKGGYILSANAGYSTGSWYHFAFVRNGSNGLIFINGTRYSVADGNLTESVAFGTNDVGNVAGTIKFGAYGTTANVNGYMDEVRISKGIARWTSNFTPPTSEYSSGYSHKVNGITPTKVSSFTPAKVNGI